MLESTPQGNWSRLKILVNVILRVLFCLRFFLIRLGLDQSVFVGYLKVRIWSLASSEFQLDPI